MEAGNIAGTVDESLLDSMEDGCSDDDPLTRNAVYVLTGSDVTADDIDGIDGADAEPITVATAGFDTDTDEYHYLAAFLPAGSYTVAFTCQADQDAAPISGAHAACSDTRTCSPGMRIVQCNPS